MVLPDDDPDIPVEGPVVCVDTPDPDELHAANSVVAAPSAAIAGRPNRERLFNVDLLKLGDAKVGGD
jgi:hypothetical protein